MSKTNGNVIEARGGGWYRVPGRAKPVRGRVLAENVMALQHLSQPTLTGRMNMLRTAGLQYQGQRDIYTTAGYIQQGSENFDNYWSRYMRDPVAGRIVDMAPKTTWKTPPEVFEGEAEKEGNPTEFEAAFAALADRLRLWRQFEKIDRLARVGKYAVMLLGVRGGDDRELEQEIEGLTGPEDLLYVTSFAEKYAKIEKWETNPTSSRFGFPLTYKLDLSSGVTAFKAKNLVVHHSRLIHVAEDALTDDTFGRPVLQRALNALDDLLKITASTGEAYWQLASRILQASVDPKMAMQPSDIDAMGESMEAIVHDLRRQFVGHGVDMRWLQGEVPDPGESLEVYKALMAVASGYPTRILFGSERGELASSQDERNYFGMINERQEQHAEPNILRATIDRLVRFNVLPPPAADGYTVLWPTLYEHTDQEIAEANKARAETAKFLTPMGGNPMDLVEIDDERNVWLKPTDESAEPAVVDPEEDPDEE